MARINLEDCWWTDPRRSKLIKALGCEEMADGAAVKMWRIAQENWKHSCRLIPKQIFFSLEHASLLLGCGLAEERGDAVYVKGSSQYLDWVREKKEKAAENGAKGGKKSAQRPRDAQGKLLPKSAKVQADAKQKPSESKLSVSISGSGGSDEPATTIVLAASGADKFIAGFCERFKAKYGTNPDITGKEAGIAKRVAKDLSAEKVETYLDAFFSLPDPWLIKRRHPMEAFEAKKNELAVFAQNGEFMTNRQAQQADSVSTNLALLQKVRGPR